MSRSTAAALILGLVLVADVAVLTLTAATPPAGGRLGITDLFFAASFIPFAAVGALIVSRIGSAVGWLFLGAASAHSGGLLLRALGITLLETVPVTGTAGLYLAWPSLLLSPLALALVLVF